MLSIRLENPENNVPLAVLGVRYWQLSLIFRQPALFLGLYLTLNWQQVQHHLGWYLPGCFLPWWDS